MNSSPPTLMDNTKARKKRRRKKKLTRILAVLFFILGIMLIIFRHDLDYYSVRLKVMSLFNFGNELGQLSEVPIGFDISGDMAYGASKENLVLLSQLRLAVYRKDGTTSLNETVSFGNPCVVSSGGRFLAFDRGGKDLLVCSSTSVIEKYIAPQVIIDAHINSKGFYAVAQEGTQARAVVTLFNNYGAPVYVFSSAENYLSAVRVGDDGQMAVAGFDVADGMLTSSILLLDKKSEQPVLKIDLKDEFVVELRLENSIITAITDVRAVAFNAKTGEEVATFENESRALVGSSVDSSNKTVLMFGRYAAGQGGTLVMLDSRLFTTGTVEVSRDVRYMASNAGKTAIVYDGGGAVYDEAGALVIETLLSGVKAAVVTSSGRAIFAQADKITIHG